MEKLESKSQSPVMEAHAIGHIRCSQTAANAGAQLATQQGFHEIHTILRVADQRPSFLKELGLLNN